MPKPNPALDQLPPPLRQAVLNLHHWEQQRRWLMLGLMWLILVPASLFGLRYNISLLRDYFTWSAVRYGLAFNPIPASGLIFTTLLTLTSLLSRWLYSHYGLGKDDVRRLEKRVMRIQAKGKAHRLWRTVWGS